MTDIDPTVSRAAQDYDRVVARAIADLTQAEPGEDLPLADLARRAGLSPFHFQRVFRRWAGVSPKRFQQYLALNRAKESLARDANVLDASFDAGLSGPSRLHDLFVALEAMSPGEYAAAAEGLVLRYGFHPTPFGEGLFMATDRGLCGLGFVTPDTMTRDETLADLAANWPRATLRADAGATAPYVDRIFLPQAGAAPLPLLVKGTNLQVRVWEALLRIPPGETATYGAIAAQIGQPRAARAVGNAVGHNAVSWLIPCHRVIRGTGIIGHYRWGSDRKRAMLAWEAARLTGEAAE